MRKKLQLLGATALAFALVNVGIDLQIHFRQLQPLEVRLSSDRADAKVQSGGRSRGGSFSRPSRSNSGDDSGSPSHDNSSPYRPSNPVFIPYRTDSGYNASGGYNSNTTSSSSGIWVMVLCFGAIAVVVYLVVRGLRKPATGTQELDNDMVTVTQLQVGLLAQAREVQANLSELVAHADSETPEGLTEQLRESVLALLRSAENWTHVRSQSETVKDRDAAAKRFEELSIAERSKFTVETLANVGGRVRRQSIAPEASDPAAYIVVTLLVGTEDDRPLVNTVHTAEELKAALQRLGSIAPEYLSVFELLWSPQAETDSLSYDEMLAAYPDLVQIV